MHPITAESTSMLLSAFRRPKYRGMGQFAEDEIVHPSGPFEGRKMRLTRQPYTRLWYEAIDSGFYSEFINTGGSQSGKSTNGFVVPILYYLFELGETVIAAVPIDDLVREKWEVDLLPVIERTRYRDLLPSKGPGSKGGRPSAVQFSNGARLIFMTGGGSDKSRASITSRVVCMTETDGFDERTSTSEEADKIEQIEARTRAYKLQERQIFKECTLTTEYGHTWRKYQEGTASKIVLPCPHCRNWVTLEREHFTGWQDAENEFEAAENSAFFCSECGEKWSESERLHANAEAKLVHRGQEITPDGQVTGPHPPTRTFGFRWSVVNNCLIPASDAGVDEFKARRAEDEDNAERKLCQFVWAIPYSPPSDVRIDLTAEQVADKVGEFGRGQIPDDVEFITVGVDVGKWELHYTLIGWASLCGYVIDYGTVNVSTSIPFESAFSAAVDDLTTNYIGNGYAGEKWLANRQNKPKWWDWVYCDCRYQTDRVFEVIKQRELHKQKWRPFKGYGLGQFSDKRYAHPRRAGVEGITAIGSGWYEKYDAARHMWAIHADANTWKTWIQECFVVEDDETIGSGLLKLYAAPGKAHYTFGRHITAEVLRIKHETGKGFVKVMESIRAANHKLDSTYMAAVAGNRCGFRKPKRKPNQNATSRQREIANLRPARNRRTFGAAPTFARR